MSSVCTNFNAISVSTNVLQKAFCSGATSDADKRQVDLAHLTQHQLQAQPPQQVLQYLLQQLQQQLHQPRLEDFNEPPGLTETPQQQLQRRASCLEQDAMELPVLTLAINAIPEHSHSSLESKEPQLQLAESASNEARLVSEDACEVGQTHKALILELGLGRQQCHEQAASEGALVQVCFCLVGHQRTVLHDFDSPSLLGFDQATRNSGVHWFYMSYFCTFVMST